MNTFPGLDQITKIGLLLFAFSISWSSALYRISMLMVLTAFIGYITMALVSKSPTSKFPPIWKMPFDPIWAIAIGLSCWVMLSFFWTTGSWELYFFDAWRYTKLWMIPVFAYLIFRVFQDKPNQLIKAFCWGCVVLMIPSFMDFFGLMHLTGLDVYLKGNPSYSRQSSSALDLTYFRNHIVHGFHVSLLFAIMAMAALSGRRLRWINTIIALCCIFDIGFLINGKMALLSLALSVLMVTWYLVRNVEKKLFFFFLLIAVFLLILVLSSTFQNRLMVVWYEAQEFFLHENIQSSSGNRLHYWKISLGMFLDNPFWGAGAGAFRQGLEATKDPLAANFHFHTHNEYLSQLSQFGLVGIILFIGLLLSVVRSCADWKTHFVQACTVVTVFVFSLNALSDSSLHNEWEGWTLVFFSGLVLSQNFSKHFQKQQ